MSTFCGVFNEIPYISVDRFELENRKSKLFFLSHCHTDHTKGLSNCTLLGPLYTSAISAVFLKKRYPGLTDVRILDMDVPTELVCEVDSKKCLLVVTALTAQHCPGSVMFLFETLECTILYTGDFRLRKSDYSKLNALRDKKVDCVYLDTTFFYKKYMYFPAPLDSINAVFRLSEEWIHKGSDHKVILETAARYGSEYLVMELGRKLKCKIYVEPDQWDQYIYIPAMDRFISQNTKECQILTKLKANSNKFDLNPSFKYRIIKPTALMWTSWREGDPVLLKQTEHTFRVCLSYHSSFSEIRDLLKFIRPKTVKANVITENFKEKRELFSNIDGVLEEINKEGVVYAEWASGETSDEIFKFNSIYTMIQEKYPEGECTEEQIVCLLPKRRRL